MYLFLLQFVLRDTELIFRINSCISSSYLSLHLSLLSVFCATNCWRIKGLYIGPITISSISSSLTCRGLVLLNKSGSYQHLLNYLLTYLNITLRYDL